MRAKHLLGTKHSLAQNLAHSNYFEIIALFVAVHSVHSIFIIIIIINIYMDSYTAIYIIYLYG